MKRICTAFAFWLVFFATAFPQDRGIIRCGADMNEVPAWTAPGRPHVVEQLSCDQMVSIIGLERGYVKIQIGDRTAYVDARYVRLSESRRQSPAQLGAQVGNSQQQSPPAQPNSALYDDFPRVNIYAGYSLLRPNPKISEIKGCEGNRIVSELLTYPRGNLSAFS